MTSLPSSPLRQAERAPVVRAAALSLIAGVPVIAVAHATSALDPALPLLAVVAWCARRGGRRAGLASAATALACTGVALALAPGATAAAIALPLALAAVAMPAVAWLVTSARGDDGGPGAGDDSLSYRTLAEALPQIVWTASPDGQVTWISERGQAFMGLTLAESTGHGWRSAVHEDDRAACDARWREALLTGESFEVEYRLRHAAEGSARWHLARALPVRGPNGGVTQWIGTCTDIHDQRAAADAIRRWELVFRHSSWGVVVLDDAGSAITAANPAFERMHGRPDGSMRLMALADVVAPEAREPLAASLARVARDGRAVFESTHLRRDGSRFPVLVDMSEVQHPDGSRYRMANYLDLTLVRAADAARETAEVRFRAVQDASPDAFVLWDIEADAHGIRDGVLRYANPAASRMVGRDLGEELGRSMKELFPAVAGSRSALYEQVHRTGVTGEVVTLHETLGLWLRLVVLKVGDGIGVIATDVSAAKEAESVLRRTRDELEELVTERTRELHHARDLAVQANRAKSDFLSRASHELRTPLSSVIGFSNILLKNKQGSLAPDELTYLSRIARNGRNLLALVNDLLDLSKIEAGRVDLELSPVSLFDVLYEVQDTLEPRAAELGLALRVEVEQENDLIIADETRLRQVLVNLAGNAIKYTRRGSVVIRVVSNAAGAPARIEVVDTGPGIPAERLDAIFQPFIVDATPAAGDAATGLGLAITRALCDLMGYRLTVESRVDHGSTFAVHLLPGDITIPPGRGRIAAAVL